MEIADFDIASYLHSALIHLPNWIDTAKDISIIVGGSIAFVNYQNQIKQKKIDNAFSVVKIFRDAVGSEDIELLTDVYFGTYESTGASDGCFTYFSYSYDCEEEATFNLRLEEKVYKIFIPEGKGLIIQNAKLTRNHLGEDSFCESLSLHPIRFIAERLEILSYEVIKGQVEFRIVYYELGQVIQAVFRLMEMAISDIDYDEKYINLESRFKNFFEMNRKYKRLISKLPDNKIANFD